MKFSISVKNNLGSNLYITEFDPMHLQHNLYSTFNEKLSCEDNDRVVLTFSISKKVPDNNGNLIDNPFLKYLKFGNEILLETAIATYELIITQIQPQLNKSNAIYNFTCQDVVSYRWPRIKLGYTYDTMERGGVRTLYTIASEILQDCELNRVWFVQDTNTHFYPNSELKTEKITLQVDNSNPYNALIEALNILNASMLINYATHEIRFYQKDKVKFSGYRYRPETNLRNLSADYNIDELATILHVVGGTDETGMNVMLVPPMPDAIRNYLIEKEYELPAGGYSAILEQDDFVYTMETDTINKTSVAYQAFQKEKNDIATFCKIADKVPSLGQFLYNFDFFQQNGTMTNEQYNDIVDIFDVKMRNINIKLKPLTVLYYDALWKMQNKLIEVETKLEQVNAIYAAYMNNEEIDFGSDISDLQNEIQNLLDSEFKNNYYSLYGKKQKLINNTYVPEIEHIITKIKNYIKIRDESEYYYHFYQEKHKVDYGSYFTSSSADAVSPDNYDKAQLQGNILYYKNKYYTVIQMCGLASSFNEFITNANKRKYPLSRETLDKTVTDADYVDSYYGIYWNRFVESLEINISDEYGIYGIIYKLEQDTQRLWSVLYNKYSNFIYEAVYENSEELDSISLYNQAIAYFEDYHHPKSNYSIDIINLDDLEQIGPPNLKVNSRIRVYNNDLNLTESENEQDKLNNISYTTNDLIVTSLDYELRKSAVMSVSVENTIQHQNILQKLIKSIK